MELLLLPPSLYRFKFKLAFLNYISVDVINTQLCINVIPKGDKSIKRKRKNFHRPHTHIPTLNERQQT